MLSKSIQHLLALLYGVLCSPVMPSSESDFSEEACKVCWNACSALGSLLPSSLLCLAVETAASANATGCLQEARALACSYSLVSRSHWHL